MIFIAFLNSHFRTHSTRWVLFLKVKTGRRRRDSRSPWLARPPDPIELTGRRKSTAPRLQFIRFVSILRVLYRYGEMDVWPVKSAAISELHKPMPAPRRGEPPVALSWELHHNTSTHCASRKGSTLPARLASTDQITVFLIRHPAQPGGHDSRPYLPTTTMTGARGVPKHTGAGMMWQWP